jgi:hypothetical protein
MANAHHQNHQLAALPFIDHAEVSHAQPSQAFEFTLQGRAGGRELVEPIDRLNDLQPICLGSSK